MVSVFKSTTDNWYPAYSCEEGSLVKVSFITAGPISSNDYQWRVCVWGMDDFGMERDFPKECKNDAWNVFLQVIGMDFVSIESLKALGFVSA